MLRFVGCIVRDHDLGLVALACVVCLLAAHTSARLLNPHRDAEHGARAIRAGIAILAFGAGIWTTHFISILAFRPDVPLSFDVSLCVLSFVLAIVATAIAYAIGPRKRGDRTAIVASGIVLTAGIGGMHFVGMRSLSVPGIIHYDAGIVVAALSLGAVCSVAAMAMLARRAFVWTSVLLALAVALTHFVAMAAVRLELVDGVAITPLAIPRSALVMAAAGACLLILFLALTASALDQHFASRLAMETRRFRALADATFEGLVFERAGQIIDVNRAMCELAGADAASLTGRPLSDLIPGMELQRTERETPLEYIMRLPSGQDMAVEILWRDAPDDGQRVVAVRDISRQKAAEGRIERMARYDPLTGLANRDLFDQQLHRALAIADRLSVGVALLYVDLDRFGLVIQALGHHATGQILIQAARRLSATVRDTDAVARVGRDEFVIIQTLTELPADSAALADRIVAEMALPFTVDDHPVVVTASVGVALYPADGAAPQTLIKNAALAMQQAKHDGRARWCYFETGMEMLLRTKRSLEHDLGVALREAQFSLNYQPFVDATTLDVVGYEALLRWDHPERGRIPPAEFIPLAEECGLIVPIGIWVLATACAETVSWDPKLTISVNLSPAQFRQPGIVTTVADVLRQTGLSPKRLELEITEGTLMADTNNALQILTSLKGLGVKISMDDFGTGYSSLSYLRKFPFDKIKIDRSFISDLEDNSEAQIIVQAIIAMSRSLRLDVTAEGVETKEQLAMLRALGCNFVQGYLLGRPRRADQLDLTAESRDGMSSTLQAHAW